MTNGSAAAAADNRQQKLTATMLWQLSQHTAARHLTKQPNSQLLQPNISKCVILFFASPARGDDKRSTPRRQASGLCNQIIETASAAVVAAAACFYLTAIMLMWQAFGCPHFAIVLAHFVYILRQAILFLYIESL